MHYRKLLIEYLNETSDFKITVIDTNTIKNEFKDKYISLKSNIKKIDLFGKKYEVNYSPELIRYISENCQKYDIVILEGVTNIINNIFIYKILKKKNVPYVWWGAGRRIGAGMTPVRKLVQPFVKKVMTNASACIAYSSIAKQYMMSVGVPEQKIFICQNTLNVSHYDEVIKTINVNRINQIREKHNLTNEKIILYVGALQKRKRVEDLIDAVAKLKNINYMLLIVGGGEHRQELEKYCNKLGLQNVKFLGEIVDGVIEYFILCDVFVLPSEGGLALNQAMICSKPVIASSADGTERDLIEQGINGYIFEEGNKEQLKYYLQLILEEKNNNLGRRSREIIDQKVNEVTFKKNFIEAINYAVENTKK
jgi:glycosyltransferase involved in cell wall biosynthesis